MDQKLKNNNIKGEINANITHYNMGKDIRNFIQSQVGTMQEDLTTSNKSIKQIAKDKKTLEN